jgi:predicted negative regulator of RcsB-dependent stress response
MSNNTKATPVTQTKLTVGKFLVVAAVIALFGAVGYQAYHHTGQSAEPPAPAITVESEKVTG